MAYGLLSGIRGKKSNREESPKQGTFWRVTVLETATRLRISRGIEKLETQATLQAIRRMKQRSLNKNTPPALVSDGGNGCEQAMLEVYGKVPPYSGRGRRPSRKVAGADWLHLKCIKYPLSPTGQRTQVKRKVVFGDPEKVLALLAKGTVCVERTHMTMRLFNARLTRKTLGYSKILDNLKLSAAWEDLYYNLGHIIRTLKIPLDLQEASSKKQRFCRKWHHRTPAMAAGLTDRVWSVKELLNIVIVNQHPNG